MNTKNRMRLTLKLYPFYEAASGVFPFFACIQMLFFAQVKGFSTQQIAMLILLSDIADLLIEYPSYKLIRRIGNSRSCVIGGIMPFIGIILITFGQSLPLVAMGRVLLVASGNFQSMAGAAARNDLMLLGEKDNYAKLMSAGNTIYTVETMAEAVVIPYLFLVNNYIPSVMSIITCGIIAVLSFFIVDHSEQGNKLPPSEDKREVHVSVGRGFSLLVAVFCLFFCSAVAFSNNSEIFLTELLGENLSEQRAVLIYGGIIWAVRLVRLVVNISMTTILEWLSDRIVIISPAVALFSFAAVGAVSLLFPSSMVPVFVTGIAYVLVKGVVWDPLRIFLRTSAVDTNIKKKQQRMLVYLNAGLSVGNTLIDLLVVGVLKLLSIEYVFFLFALIGIGTFICAVMLKREFNKSTQLMQYETELDDTSVDDISQRIYDALTGEGMRKKEALSYRLLLEEKLMECKKAGNKCNVSVSIVSRLGDLHIKLKVEGEERDIFMLPETDDTFSQMIFRNVLGMFER